MGEFGPKIEASRINLAEAADFDLGGLCVSPARREVSMNGQRRELEPRVAQVLIALAWARPDVVSRDRLIEQCWEGRIVGDDALNRCIVALRHLAREFSPQPFEIETVSRVGYSMVERPEVTAARGAGKFRAKMAIAALLVMLVATGLAFSWSRFSRSQPAPASIAVLPFQNLSTGDPYFAQGVGEEIMGRLAREPAFRVAGSASAAQFSGPSDPRKVGKALNVDYILEGSVRPGGGRVRINAALIRTKDGMRLWSETYDRELADILEIQGAIGLAVANGLRRELINAAPGAARAVNGEAYALYLNARGLIRSQNPQSGQDAIGLLQQAIRLDPGYAPAWASLAQALQLDGKTKGPEGLIAAWPRAHSAARRALLLDPNLAEAHGALAILLGGDSPEAVAHLRRASELDPRSSEGLHWRAAAHQVAGEYADAIAANRQAHDSDPLWPFMMRVLVDVYSAMGDRAAAEAMAIRLTPGDKTGRHFAFARVAWMSGDFSEAARRWSIVANEPGSRWARPAGLSLENAMFMLNLSKRPAPQTPLAFLGQYRMGPRVWMSAAPSAAEWQNSNRSFAAALVNQDVNVVAAKRMLAVGRAGELVATYDSPIGLLYMRRGVRVGVCDLQEAAILAMALRDVGRNAEAEALLRESDALIRSIYRRGKVPMWFDEDAAALWAVQGKAGAAVDALERALRRGATHSGRTDLPSLEEEPAFRLLRDDPRFKAVLAKYNAHYAKEREETARALKLSA